MENQNTLIENIQSLMVEHGYTQTSLARELGKQPVVINRALNGKVPISAKMQLQFANLFGISVEELNGTISKITLSGFVKYDGEIIEVNSFPKLKKLCEQVDYDVNVLPTKAKSIIKRDKENKAHTKPYQFTDKDFDFDTIVEYDAEQYECYAFKTAEDENNGIQLDLGNQCAGYPIELNGHIFGSNESLYLCGQFSLNSPACIDIQRRLIAEQNGFRAKKYIKTPNAYLIRKDWGDDTILRGHWMLFCIWLKCKQNKAFSDKLKAIPRDAIIIENSTTIHESTAPVWGMMNPELEEARDIVARYAKLKKKDSISARNSIQHIGTYSGGKNLTGKCLKLCQLALLNGKEPPIDYDLLNRKQLYLMGELLKFDTKETNHSLSPLKINELASLELAKSPLMGVICGDIIGVPYERRAKRTKDYNFPILIRESHFSDDTVLSLAITEWLTGERTDNRLRSLMRKYGRKYLNCGFSKTTKQWIKQDDETPCGSFGNGAAMRVAAIGWAAKDINDALTLARQSANITHNTSEGVRGAQAVAAAVYLNRTGSSKQEVRDYIEQNFGYDLSKAPEEIRPEYKFDATCDGSVPQAISCWLYSDNYEQTIRNAVSLGGDADTLASIAGGIAIATKGWAIPEEWCNACYDILPENFKEIVQTFESVIKDN